MRTLVLFDTVDASQNHTSEVLDFDGQDARFLIQAVKTGTDGDPRLIIEESVTGDIWTPLENVETWNDYTEIDDSEAIAVKDNYFMGKFFRARLEANGTTAGTIYAEMCYKTKP